MHRFAVTASLLLAALCIELHHCAEIHPACRYWEARLDEEGFRSTSFGKTKVFDLKLNYEDAKQHCRSVNGALLEFTTSRDLLLTDTACWLNIQYNSMRIWIGAVRGNQGTYRWTNTNEEVRPPNFVGGEPNFANGEERCLEMNWKFLGRFNDAHCDSLKGFVCLKSY